MCTWITGDVLKCRFWFIKFGMGPEILHFWPALKWCDSCHTPNHIKEQGCRAYPVSCSCLLSQNHMLNPLCFRNSPLSWSAHVDYYHESLKPRKAKSPDCKCRPVILISPSIQCQKPIELFPCANIRELVSSKFLCSGSSCKVKNPGREPDEEAIRVLKCRMHTPAP